MGTHQKDPVNWAIKRHRNGREHIDACKEGYYQTTHLYMQVHHILPIESLANATIEAQLQDVEKFNFILKCMMVTDWKINAVGNVVGLPLKRVLWAPLAPPGWTAWPCHQVDHNPKYNMEVCNDLKSKVWNIAIENAEECYVNGTDLATALSGRSDWWQTELERRATRGGPADDKGVAYCWEHREKLPDTWYRPFSMAADPSSRSVPKALSGSLEAYVRKLFEII